MKRRDDAGFQVMSAGNTAYLGESTGHFRDRDEGFLNGVGGQADEGGTDGDDFILDLIEEGVDGVDAEEEMVGVFMTMKVPGDTDDVVELGLNV